MAGAAAHLQVNRQWRRAASPRLFGSDLVRQEGSFVITTAKADAVVPPKPRFRLWQLRSMKNGGARVAQLVKRLPRAPAMIPGSWDQVPQRGGVPAQRGACFSLPLCCSSLCQINL